MMEMTSGQKDRHEKFCATTALAPLGETAGFRGRSRVVRAAVFRSVDRGSSPAQIDLTFTFRFTATEMTAVRVCVCARLEHVLP